MKRYQSYYRELTPTRDVFVGIGRCDGDEPIAVGDAVGQLVVVKIEAYGHQFDELSPGMTARLTLHWKQGVKPLQSELGPDLSLMFELKSCNP